MLHPSYTDLMKVVNSDVEIGEEPVVNSRYSIVIATAKRARQLIAGDEAMIPGANGKKPFSIAVEEMYEGKVKILGEEETAEEEAANEDASNEEVANTDSTDTAEEAANETNAESETMTEEA